MVSPSLHLIYYGGKCGMKFFNEHIKKIKRLEDKLISTKGIGTNPPAVTRQARLLFVRRSRQEARAKRSATAGSEG